MSSITLTNVNQFTEQPERQIIKTYGGLDRMTVVLWGPYWLAEQQRPAEGSPHSDYPLMFCVNSDIKRKDGALSAITVNYAGRTDASGGSNFVSEKLISFNASEKELSYNQIFSVITGTLTTGSTSTSVDALATGLVQSWIYKVGIGNYVLRYLTTDATYKYCARPVPSGPILGGGNTNVKWQYSRFTGLSAATQIISTEALAQYTIYLQQTAGPFGYVSSLRCTNFTANQVIEGWAECTETYDFRYEIGT